MRAAAGTAPAGTAPAGTNAFVVALPPCWQPPTVAGPEPPALALLQVQGQGPEGGGARADEEEAPSRPPATPRRLTARALSLGRLGRSHHVRGAPLPPPSAGEEPASKRDAPLRLSTSTPSVGRHVGWTERPASVASAAAPSEAAACGEGAVERRRWRVLRLGRSSDRFGGGVAAGAPHGREGGAGAQDHAPGAAMLATKSVDAGRQGLLHKP